MFQQERTENIIKIIEMRYWNTGKNIINEKMLKNIGRNIIRNTKQRDYVKEKQLNSDLQACRNDFRSGILPTRREFRACKKTSFAVKRNSMRSCCQTSCRPGTLSPTSAPTTSAPTTSAPTTSAPTTSVPTRAPTIVNDWFLGEVREVNCNVVCADANGSSCDLWKKLNMKEVNSVARAR